MISDRDFNFPFKFDLDNSFGFKTKESIAKELKKWIIIWKWMKIYFSVLRLRFYKHYVLRKIDLSFLSTCKKYGYLLKSMDTYI